ncbi:MAG: S9 family peptidase [Verrucomicrobiales bacterium]|nr:S9 family peptidase [Verrucomicrobiales bacterium]
MPVRRPRPRVLVQWLSILLAIAPFALPAAEDPPDTLTPVRIARLRAVGEVNLAPDGRYAAYTLSVPRQPGIDDDGEPWSELWVLTLSTGEQRPFITGKVNVSKPAWTKDGKGIAFLAKRGDDKFKALHVIPVDGGEARKAAELPKTDVSDFSLAPEGAEVAMVGTPPEAEARKKLRDKGFKQEIFEEDLRLARLWVGRLFETNRAALRSLDLAGSVRAVQWSPAGPSLAVALSPNATVDDGLVRQRVIVVDPATGTTKATVDHAAKLEAISWSPDGSRLALRAGNSEHDPSAGRLMIVPATGGSPREAVPGLEGDFEQVAWVDSDELLAVVSEGVTTQFRRIRLLKEERGRSGQDISSAAKPGHPILGAFSLSANGRVAALIGHTPNHPAELFTWTKGETTLVRRTDSNPDLANINWAKQEVVRHKARDGLALEGVLIRPRELKPGTRAPLILAVHGGPESHVSDGWVTSYSNPGQVAAARGFAVFYPNYRGSTGRGVSFSKLGQGDAAGKEFDDLVDAVDHLVEMGLVDPKRVGITGGSYGGYATAWCSTRYSDRFAAGVMFVGISDKISKVGTTDIPDEEFLVHALKRPWDDWQFLLERSPVYHAGDCRTPLLILHGTDDPRVHPGQSKEMYRHLKLRSQAPVRLVLYPGEGHGNRKAAARLDYNLRMLQWFEHYLQGPGGPMPQTDLDYPLPASTTE